MFSVTFSNNIALACLANSGTSTKRMFPHVTTHDDTQKCTTVLYSIGSATKHELYSCKYTIPSHM